MRTAFLRTKYFWLFVAFFSVLSSPALAELTVTDNWVLQSKTRVGRTVFEYVYKAELSNTGPAAADVTATITSSAPATTIVDGDLDFGDVAAGETVTSLDTFAIRQDRSVAFDPASLQWEISSASPDLPLAVTEADPLDVTYAGDPDLIDGVSATDSNGNIIYAFVENHWDSSDIKITENVSGNYYPDYEFITSGFIKVEYPEGHTNGYRTQIKVRYSQFPDRVVVWDGERGLYGFTPWTTSRDDEYVILSHEIYDRKVIFALISINR